MSKNQSRNRALRAAGKTYSLVNFDLHIESEESLKALAEMESGNAALMLMILESIGWDTIAHLRSHIGGTRPPVRRGESERTAHPGGWADVSGDLAAAYHFEVHADGKKVRWTESGEGGIIRPVYLTGSLPEDPKPPYVLVLINGLEYAAYLEANIGYFVLSGVTNPGGPVERALEAAIATRSDWELT